MLSYIDYWTYVYALKDYQGSTRVTLTSAYLKNTGSLTYSSSEQIDYYLFGLERSNTGQSSGGVFNSGTNPYLYSANEIDRLNGLHQYDFHARWLDAAVPGFSTPDPLSERHYNENPYAYCGLDPVNRIDPLGLDWFLFSDKGNLKYIWFEGQTKSFYKNGYTFMHAGKTIYYTNKSGDLIYGDDRGELMIIPETEFVFNGTRSYDSNNNSPYGFAPPVFDGEGNDSDEVDNQKFNTLNLTNTITGAIGVGGEALGYSKYTYRVMNSRGFSLKFFKSGWRGNQYNSTFGVSNIGRGISKGASVVTTTLAYVDISKGKGNTLTYVDAAVGTVGLANLAAGYLGFSTVPVIGQAVGLYGLSRLCIDLGSCYGPSKWYGEDDTKWFE